MKYIEFSNKDKMPLLGLGTWKAEKGEVYGAVCEAIKMGYRHIDCAMIYGNEAEIGLAIKDSISDDIVKREDLWITSKLWNSNHGRGNVVNGLKKTLIDLQLKYLDLYLIHWPISLKHGIGFPSSGKDFIHPNEIPIEETWKGMEEVLEMGLTRHIGLSNFNSHKIEHLLGNCEYAPEMLQVEMHPLLQQKKLVEFCQFNNIKMTAYSPLGAKDKNSPVKQLDLFDEPVILDISERYNITPAQVLLAWQLNRGISAIPKSVNKDRMLQNLKAIEIELKQEDLDKIANMNKNYRFISGKLWAMAGSPYTLEDLWGE